METCAACHGENAECPVCRGWGRTETLVVPYYVAKALRAEHARRRHELKGMSLAEYIARRLVYGYF